MDKHCRQTGRLRWEKNSSGHVVVVTTPEGERRIPTGTFDKREAVKLARKWKKVASNRFRFDQKMIAALTGVRALKFSKALELWKESCSRNCSLQPRTIDSYAIAIAAWLRFSGLANEIVTAARDVDVASWLNADDGTKIGTRRGRLSVLQTFFDWLCASGYTITNPARIVKKPNMSNLSFAQKETKHKQPFTDAQITTLLNYIDAQIAKETRDLNRIDEMFRKTGKGYDIAARIERLKFWRAAVMISRWTGLRLGDVAGLERESLTTPGVICVWTDKRDRRVEIPISAQLTDMLWTLRTEHPRFVFPAEQKKNASSARSTLNKQFAKLLEGAGIEDRSFHCLRSTCAIDLLDRLISAGKTREEAERIVADTLGHAKTSTTRESYLNGGKK